jgi:RNA recognition motif-containing protein
MLVLQYRKSTTSCELAKLLDAIPAGKQLCSTRCWFRARLARSTEIRISRFPSKLDQTQHRPGSSTASTTSRNRSTYMTSSIFIGNLNHSCIEEDLLDIFSQFETLSVTFCTDRDTEQPRGFGFVQLDSAEDAQRAISQLHGTELHERRLTVSEARDNPAGRRARTSLNSHL